MIGTFRRGVKELGINSNDPVPMSDEFIKRAQGVWFPDAPKENLVNHSIENVPEWAVKKMNEASAAALTAPRSSGGILTGRSSIYYNPSGNAFISAKQLFFTMGHEFIHVSQFAALAGQPVSLINQSFVEIMEFHAHSFEWNVLGSGNSGGFNSIDASNMIRQFPNHFEMLSYQKFPWALTPKKFNYPF